MSGAGPEAGSRLGLPGHGATVSGSEPPDTRAVPARPTTPAAPPDAGQLALRAGPGGSSCRQGQGQPCAHRRPSRARRPYQRALAAQPFPRPPSQTTCPTAREQNAPVRLMQGGSPHTCLMARPAPSCMCHAGGWPRTQCCGVGVQPGLVTAGSPQDPGGVSPSESPTLVWLSPTARQTHRSRRHPDHATGPGRQQAWRPGLGGCSYRRPDMHPVTEQEQSGLSYTC